MGSVQEENREASRRNQLMGMASHSDGTSVGRTASALENPGIQKEGHMTSATSQDKRCPTSQDKEYPTLQDKRYPTSQDKICETPQRKRAWIQSTIISSMGRSSEGNEENEGGMDGGKKRRKKGEKEKGDLRDVARTCSILTSAEEK